MEILWGWVSISVLDLSRFSDNMAGVDRNDFQLLPRDGIFLDFCWLSLARRCFIDGNRLSAEGADRRYPSCQFIKAYIVCIFVNIRINNKDSSWPVRLVLWHSSVFWERFSVGLQIFYFFSKLLYKFCIRSKLIQKLIRAFFIFWFQFSWNNGQNVKFKLFLISTNFSRLTKNFL